MFNLYSNYKEPNKLPNADKAFTRIVFFCQSTNRFPIFEKTIQFDSYTPPPPHKRPITQEGNHLQLSRQQHNLPVWNGVSIRIMNDRVSALMRSEFGKFLFIQWIPSSDSTQVRWKGRWWFVAVRGSRLYYKWLGRKTQPTHLTGWIGTTFSPS